MAGKGRQSDSCNHAGLEKQLQKILASPGFAKAQQSSRLLRFLVERAAEGKSHELKEYAIGTAVLGRPADYDPRLDPAVRQEVRRLRLKLAEYYQTAGAQDPLIIEIPKGGYAATFRTIETPKALGRRTPFVKPKFVAAGALVAAMVVFSLLGLRHSALSGRRSVAVVGMRDLSARPESNWIGIALSEMLNAEFASGTRVQTVPQDEIARMRRELSLTLPVRNRNQLDRVRRNIGADVIVSGSYAVVGDQIRVQLSAVDARTGESLSDVIESGAETELLNIAARVGGKVRRDLGINGSAEADARRLSQQFPSAMELYAKGLDHLRGMDPLKARDLLQQAARADPANPLILAELAKVWSTLGYDQRADEAAMQALAASSKLDRIERLVLEAKCRAVLHQWPEAIRLYSKLVREYPDDLEYGLLLGAVEVQAGRGSDALRLSAQLRKLPAPTGIDPRIDLLEARAAGQLSDYRRARAAAEAAAEKASSMGARLVYARARLFEAGVMETLGENDAPVVRSQARSICAELGDKACVAAADRIEGNSLATNGQLTHALQLYSGGLQCAREVGSAPEILHLLNGISYCARRQGELDRAERTAREALDLARSLRSKNGILEVLPQWVEVLIDRDRLAEAQDMLHSALALAREVRDRASEGWVWLYLAEIAAKRRQPAAARQDFETAIRTLRPTGDRWGVILALTTYGSYLVEQGDIKAGHRKLEEMQKERSGMKDPPGDLEAALALARLALAEGNVSEAESRAREAQSLAMERPPMRAEAAALVAKASAVAGHKTVGESHGDF